MCASVLRRFNSRAAHRARIACGALACLSALAGCLGDGTDEAPGGLSGDDDCTGSCATADWPRVLLGVIGPSASEVRLEATTPNDDGTERAVRVAGGCGPSGWPESLPCTHRVEVSTRPSITLTVRADGRQPQSALVELAPNNYCARDITYVQIEVDEAAVQIHDARYVSPCDVRWSDE